MIAKSLLYKLTDENNIVIHEGSAKEIKKIQSAYKKKGKKYQIWLGSSKSQLGEKLS